MANSRQIKANRANSKKSRGPSSARGKQITARNAVKHGLLSDGPLIDGEDPAEYQQHRERLIADLDPQGELELLLADRIVGCFWKLRRAGLLEAALLKFVSVDPSKRDRTAQEVLNEFFDRVMDANSRNERTFTASDDSINDANSKDGLMPAPSGDSVKVSEESSAESSQVKVEEKDGEVEDPQKRFQSILRVHVRDMLQEDKMSRFQRYELHIESMLNRSLNLFQRMQFLRSRPSAAPALADTTRAPKGPAS
jgi:hypothetical protein